MKSHFSYAKHKKLCETAQEGEGHKALQPEGN